MTINNKRIVRNKKKKVKNIVYVNNSIKKKYNIKKIKNDKVKNGDNIIKIVILLPHAFLIFSYLSFINLNIPIFF